MKEKRVRLWLALIAALLITVYIALYIYQKRLPDDSAKLPQEQTLVLDTLKPIGKTVVVPKNYIGQVQAINETDILPQISGYVEKINVKGGENVKTDDVLLVVEQSTYLAELDAAMANKFAAQAELVNAKRQFERLKHAGREAVSASELENAGAAYLKAQGAYEQAGAAVEKANIDYSHTILKAPFSGIVGNIEPSVGDYISPQSQPLLSVVQYSPIRVVFSVTDKEYLSKEKNRLIYADNNVKLRLPDGQIYDDIGKVKYTANSVNPHTDSLAVYAEFANFDHKLIPNAYVNVMVEEIYENAISIEKNLVSAQEDGKSVYVLQNGTIKKKFVDVLSENENHYILRNNFTPDEMLITQKIEPRYAGHKAVPQSTENGGK